MTARWPLRRIVFWAVVLGFVGWIITSPAQAGNEVASLAQTLLGWIEQFFTAISAFFQDLTK
jgi:hypothetical protein